jgi:hypothetical protein
MPASSPVPLLVGINDEVQSGWYAQEVRTYYVWIFGYTMRLPFERNVGKPSKRNSRPVGEFVIPLPNAETRESRMFGSSSVDEGPE